MLRECVCCVLCDDYADIKSHFYLYACLYLQISQWVSCNLSPASLQEMIITELQAETTYSVTVAAYTTKGDGARSKPKLMTTTGAGNVTFTADKPSLVYC